MINRKAIGYITANYSSTYGSVLLKDRPIASVPFLGRYRLIDFPLSNMMNAGIKTVGVVMPGNYRSLIDHVAGSAKLIHCNTELPSTFPASSPLSLRVTLTPRKLLAASHAA